MTQHYFGVELNQYEVYKQNDAGEWRPIEIGDVSNAEIGRTFARAQREEKKGTQVPRTSTTNKGGTRRKNATKQAEPWPGLKASFRGRAQKRSAAPLSPFQQRIQQLKDNARRTLEDKKACGENQ